MKKIILWGMGNAFRQHIYAVKYQEMNKQIEVIGVTSDNDTYTEYYGYKYIPKIKIIETDYDYIVVMAEENAHKQIIIEAQSLGIDKDNIFNYRVFELYGFDMERYLELKENPPSIFSNNCWGGLTYHSLDMEFTSPLINMFEKAEDYIKLLKDPKKYMEYELELLSTKYDKNMDINYPIVKCGDITLYFNHYKSFEEAKISWERRKRRINWDNIFVMFHTSKREELEQFLSLSYKKKICFVSFESSEDGVVYVDNKEYEGKAFWECVVFTGDRRYQYYNVFDLLLEGKFTSIGKIT